MFLNIDLQQSQFFEIQVEETQVWRTGEIGTRRQRPEVTAALVASSR